jgi:hypothetical protein
MKVKIKVQVLNPFCYTVVAKCTVIWQHRPTYVSQAGHLFFHWLDWRKSSLVRKGVIKLDCGEREGLLIPENIHRGKLEEYARVSTI